MTRRLTKLWLRILRDDPSGEYKVTDRVPWFVEAKERGGGKGARNSWNVDRPENGVERGFPNRLI